MEMCAKLSQGLLWKSKRQEVGVHQLSQCIKASLFSVLSELTQHAKRNRCDQLEVSFHSTRLLNISPYPLSSKSAVKSTVSQPPAHSADRWLNSICPGTGYRILLLILTGISKRQKGQFPGLYGNSTFNFFEEPLYYFPQ